MTELQIITVVTKYAHLALTDRYSLSYHGVLL